MKQKANNKYKVSLSILQLVKSKSMKICLTIRVILKDSNVPETINIIVFFRTKNVYVVKKNC